MLTRLRDQLRARRCAGDAGVSLTELLVAMGIATVLGAMTLSLFVAVNTSSASTTDRTVNTGQARVTLLSWTAYLQVADGSTPGSVAGRIEWLAANDLLFYADLANRNGSVDTTGAPTMVWLRLDAAGNLVEEQFPSNAGAGTRPTVCRTLGVKVSTARLFTPTAADGTDLSAADLGAAPTAGPGCQDLPVTVPSRSAAPDPVAAAATSGVASVTIGFTLTDTRGAHPQQFAATATLPTLGGAQ